MKLGHSNLSIIVLLHLLFLSQVTLSAKTMCPLLRATGASASEKTGCFIIVLNRATSARKFQSILSEVIEMSKDAKVYGSVQRVAKAFTVKLSEDALEVVSSLTVLTHLLIVSFFIQ